MKICNFGEHLMIDGYGADEKKLSSRDLVLNALNDLPGRIGMRKLSEPDVYWAEPNHIKDPGGWSGFIVVAESHISIHTFPIKKFVSIDVYTCKNGMDVKFIERYFQKLFGIKDLESNFLKRGNKYPLD